MTYESMIDNMNESSQMDFLQYSMESIGLNEAFDIKGKFEAIKNGVLGIIRTIRQKVSDIINYIRSKFKKSSVKEKADSSTEKINKIDDNTKKQVTEKVAAKYKAGNGSVEKKGPRMVEASGAGIKIYEIDDNEVKSVFADQEEMISDLTKISDALKSPKSADSLIMSLHSRKSQKYAKDAKDYDGIGVEDGENSGLIIGVSKDKPINVKIVSSATINLIVSNYEKADQYLTKENGIISKFNQTLNNTESKINQCKPQDFQDNNAFNSFNRLSKNLIYNIKICFKALKSVAVDLSLSMKEYEQLLTRVNQVISTYNADI